MQQHFKSTHEFMHEDVWKWRFIEQQLEQSLELYNYQEIRLSVLQDYNVLKEGITALLDHDEADQVVKQVLNLCQPDQEISLLSLRPEGTISVLHHTASKFNPGEIHRFYYHGAMFRKDANLQPMEFYQLGVEMLGSDSILSENEIISLSTHLCHQLGLRDVWLEINSFGCETCRPQYFEAVRKHLDEHRSEYCENCFNALYINPLANSGCQKENCQHVIQQGPHIHDFICKKCNDNFIKVKKIQANLANHCKVNSRMFKNFAYYNETVFDIQIKQGDNTITIGGGGRYDFLSNRITNKQIPAVGFYLNLDLIFQIMAERDLFHYPENQFKVYLCAQTPELEIMLLQIVQELHAKNIITVLSAENLNTAVELNNAKANNCSAIIILREDNIRDGKALFRNLIKEHQEYVPLSDIIKEVQLARKSLLSKG